MNNQSTKIKENSKNSKIKMQKAKLCG